jgi:Tfp pilus assembly protein PilF
MLCSKKSDNPYRISDADINIYSIEELAYYLYNNAYFVDESFFDESLVEYIEKELKLTKVAQKLKYAMGQNRNFVELVMIIVNSSMYYNESEMKSFEKELKNISAKDMMERMKARADMLLENGKLGSAKKTYMDILNNNVYKKPEQEFYADVHLGLGRILCRMYYFEEALEEFNKAYELKESDDILQKIICAKLLQGYLNEEDVDLSQEININSELVDKCKEEFKDNIEEIENSSEYEKLSKVFIYDGRRNLDDYYEGVQIVLDEWKCDYRYDIT